MSTNPRPPCRFFLVQTSLQFILASALAEEARGADGRSTLAFLPDVLDPTLFRRAIEAWPDSPFERVVFVAPRTAPGQTGAHRPKWHVVKRELLDALHQSQPTVVTVFNDRQDTGQAVLIEAARRFPQALRECVEDGALSYTGFTYREHSFVTRWRQRWRQGPAWHNVHVLGTHPLVQQFTAIHPRLLRPELRGRNVNPFPAQALSAQPLQHLAGALCALGGFDASALSGGAVLLILNHSSYAQRNPDYLRLVQACVQRLQQQSIPFFFKFHPRESAPDFAGIGTTGLGRELPRTVPVECIFLLSRELPLLVVAGMSTSLLTGGLLMPRARIAALVHASDTGDTWGDALLQALQIQPLHEAGALSACIDAWRDSFPAAATQPVAPPT